MKIQTNLTSIQLIFFIIQTQIGVGVLGLPFSVFSVSKSDAWISVLLAGFIVQVLIVLFWILGRRFPKKTLFQYSRQLLGKVAGSIVNISFILYGVLVTALILMYSTAIIKTWVLPLTPKWIVMFLLIFTGIYLGKEKVAAISDVYVVVSSLIFFLLLISVVVLVTYPIEWRYLLPIGQSGGIQILKGAKEAYFSMLGFELLLFLFPYFQHNGERSVLYSASIANLFVTMTYTFLTIVSLITFSPEEIVIVPQPVLYFVKSLYLQIVERIDLVFMSLWVVNVITSLTSYLFLSTEGSIHTFRWFKRKRYIYTLLFGMVAFIIALIPGKEGEMEIYNKMVINLSYLYILVIPVILLSISYLFKKTERGGDA
ncbi:MULTISPECIES: GerAB/ArcD/ProY family transporter [Rossellomorea]|uniref:GerAB/ArcD/ProY family transporter n=1 Tax=Rossellomorea TaxID=2837508 RepID=UPI001CCF9732|nr:MULTISPECIES: GerAB/ArcD/ProY family transporter [Rossellomorea]MCA0148017.1 spore germination protein [Rossellomorea vietnamensis]WGG43794.1 GerAB/ArcD/ProY family transporter [Rossellomorea sp. DA94]